MQHQPYDNKTGLSSYDNKRGAQCMQHQPFPHTQEGVWKTMNEGFIVCASFNQSESGARF